MPLSQSMRILEKYERISELSLRFFLKYLSNTNSSQ